MAPSPLLPTRGRGPAGAQNCSCPSPYSCSSASTPDNQAGTPQGEGDAGWEEREPRGFTLQWCKWGPAELQGHTEDPKGEVWEAQGERRTPHKSKHTSFWGPYSGGRGEAELRGGRQGFRRRERAGAEENGNTMRAPRKEGEHCGGRGIEQRQLGQRTLQARSEGR